MNIENSEKVKVTALKILLLKSCRILDLNSEYYVPAIEILAFNIPHVYIIEYSQCASKLYDMFVSQHNNYDHKFTHGYAERC